MEALAFLRWWYGAGWRHLIKRQLDGLLAMLDRFSVTILLRTMFSPWKRVITYADRSVAGLFRAMLDNLISRFVGFSVRVVVLITACIMITAITIFGLLAVILWPVLPLLSLGLIVWGIAGS